MLPKELWDIIGEYIQCDVLHHENHIELRLWDLRAYVLTFEENDVYMEPCKTS